VKNRIHNAIVSATALFLSGCITPYEAPFLNEDFEDLLVVEGTITNGETIIKLSRSYPLYPDSNDTEEGGSRPVYGAAVWIEGNNGDRFDAEDRLTGEYIASDVTFSDGVSYRLRIAVDGEEYESDYRLPQTTPPIESVDFHLNDDNENEDPLLQVRFNVNADDDASRYYLWRYEEDWEIHAAQRAVNYFGHPSFPGKQFSFAEFIDGNGVVPMDFPGGETPYYYCWKNNRSKELLLATTDLLTENYLQDHVLYEIALDDDRLSSLYHTEISLYAMGEDAYFYYLNQRKNTDETGSIFGPIPAEMRGNIVSTTSPDVPVVGFVDVSSLTQYGVYLPVEDSPYQPTGDPYMIYNGSREDVVEKMVQDTGGIEVRQYMNSFYAILAYPAKDDYFETYNVSITTKDCIDCRLSGGTKNRPSWWPNDHY
jgi:hypothetical protein